MVSATNARLLVLPLAVALACGAGACGSADSSGDPRFDAGGADSGGPPFDATAPDSGISRDGAVDSSVPRPDAGVVEDASTGVVGEVCATAPLVTAGTTTGQTLDRFDDDYGAGDGCATALDGADRLYRVRVARGERLVARVSPRGVWSAAVSLMNAAGCSRAGRACLAGSTSASVGLPATARWMNDTTVDEDVFVVVEGDDQDGAGKAFDLTLELVRPPAGDACSTGEALVPGVPFEGGTLDGFDNDYGDGASCVGTAGPERFFSVQVRAGERLEVAVTPSSGTPWNPSVNLMSAAQCGAPRRACLAGVDAAGRNGAEQLRWSNDGPLDVSVLVAVETASADVLANAARPNFTIAATVVPMPVGDVCSDALQAITATTTLASESMTGFSDNYAFANTNACEFSPGIDRAFRVVVPPNRTLTARVTPGGPWDPTLGFVLGSVPSSSSGVRVTCAAAADAGYAGDPEVITYRNATSSPAEGFLIIDSYTTNATAPLDFGLALTIE